MQLSVFQLCKFRIRLRPLSHVQLSPLGLVHRAHVISPALRGHSQVGQRPSLLESGNGKANHESLWVRTNVRAHIRTHVRCNVETGACWNLCWKGCESRSMPTEPFRTIPGDQCHHRPLLAFLFSLQEAFSLPCGETDVADVAFDEAGWLSNFMQQPKLQARSS